MKNIFLVTLVATIAFLTACNDDDTTPVEEPIDFEYHAHIMSPSSAIQHVGDSIHLHVEFESHSGETVHHVQVSIFNKADSTVIYTGLADAHVHAMNGSYAHHDDFVLSEANGVTGHTDWIVEAKVWAMEAGVGEVVETFEFHVHP